VRSSSSFTPAPPSASSHASIKPVGPAPTTTTSGVSTSTDGSCIAPRRLTLNQSPLNRLTPRPTIGVPCSPSCSPMPSQQRSPAACAPVGPDGVRSPGAVAAGLADLVVLNCPGRPSDGTANVDWVPELSMNITSSIRRARRDHERAGSGDRRVVWTSFSTASTTSTTTTGASRIAAQLRRRAGRVLRRDVRARV